MLTPTLTDCIKHHLKRTVSALIEDVLLLILLMALIVLTLIAPDKISSYPSLVDWPTIAALTGLLILTKGLEISGSLHRLGLYLITLMATERATALCFVMAAAMLSTLLTNDVALFVVVPLTLGVCRLNGMSAPKLIIFEALAVNAGSALTPIGNPQNLFLWQLSGVSFGQFVLHMLPLVLLSVVALIALTIVIFPNQAVTQNQDKSTVQALDRPLFIASIALYIPFLIATDLHQTVWAITAVILFFLLLRPKVLTQVDWGLLLVFILMFIDLRLFVSLDVVHHLISRLDLNITRHLYWTSIVASQVISNVPAAIALAEYSKDWRVLAYGVNIGGFGFVVGSLANLIALRMAGDRKAWLTFHYYSVPFLCFAMAVAYVLIF